MLAYSLGPAPNACPVADESWDGFLSPVQSRAGRLPPEADRFPYRHTLGLMPADAEMIARAEHWLGFLSPERYRVFSQGDGSVCYAFLRDEDRRAFQKEILLAPLDLDLSSF